jgi:importin-7
LLESPLDKIEPYSLFRNSLLSKLEVKYAINQDADQLELQQEQPPLYDSLTKILDPADQQVLQGVIHEAEKLSAQS